MFLWRSLVFKIIKRLTTRLFPTVEWITTEELVQWLNEPVPQPLILDARSEAEYALSHLKEAKRVAPDHPDLAVFAEVSKDTPIVVYCSVGYRSAAVASQFKAEFSHVYNLEGSIFKWVNEGHPVVKDGKPTLLVHPYGAFWGRLLKPRYRASLTQIEPQSSLSP